MEPWVKLQASRFRPGGKRRGKGARLRLECGCARHAPHLGGISEGCRRWKSDFPGGWPITGRQLQNHGMDQGCASPY